MGFLNFKVSTMNNAEDLAGDPAMVSTAASRLRRRPIAAVLPVPVVSTVPLGGRAAFACIGVAGPLKSYGVSGMATAALSAVSKVLHENSLVANITQEAMVLLVSCVSAPSPTFLESLT